MIRAVVRQGVIQPLDALPAEWREGQVLEVSESAEANWPPTTEEIDAWVAEVEESAGEVSEEDHAIVDAALSEHEALSKVLGRRELERLP
jgi:hypothetical protein